MQPAKIKARGKLPDAKNIGQRGLALQPPNLHRRGAALSVKKPWHTQAHAGLLRKGPRARAIRCLLREQLQRHGGIAFQPRTGQKGRKGLPVCNAHIHLAVNAGHARRAHRQWQGQGRRHLSRSDNAQDITL